MGKGRADGVTRGDLRRNARKARLRAMVPAGNAVAGLDLGEKKQALVVTGLDGRLLARRSPRVTVHGLGAVLDWAAEMARAAGFAGLTVACEPTGSRWMVVQELCAQRGVAMVCVQPLVSHVAREQQDLTGDKTDEGDCVLIARLARELHCYVLCVPRIPSTALTSRFARQPGEGSGRCGARREMMNTVSASMREHQGLGQEQDHPELG